MVIVDTSALIDHLRGLETAHTAWLEGPGSARRLALTDLILSEVLQGYGDEARFEATRVRLASFYVFATGGVPLALAAARNYRALRARGRTVRGTVDNWIATFCLMNGHQLLHNDRDFDHYENVLGLRVIHP
jgi:hypothetical protein